MSRRSTLLIGLTIGALGLILAGADEPPAKPSSIHLDPATSALAPPAPAATPLHRAALASADDPARYETDDDGAYFAGQVMVRISPDTDVAALAADVGARVLREPGPSGYAALSPARGQDRASLLASLADDPRVLRASGVGVVHGAAAGSGLPAPWHREALQGSSALAQPASRDLSGFVVAVLDTGVAYPGGAEAGGPHAAGLAGVSIVAPRDFV